MKNRLILITMTFIIMGLAQAAYAQPPVTLEKKKIQGPDLITDGIREMDLNNGKLEVAVVNIGQNPSKKSQVRIGVAPTDSPKTTRSAEVKALAPGETVWIPLSFDMPLNLADYCAIADALKQNAETNEKNNKVCGKFSGKP